MTTDKLLHFIRDIRGFLTISSLLFHACVPAIADSGHMIEAEAAEAVGGASQVADDTASGGCLVGLTKPGQGLKFTGLPAAGRLAICCASVQVGTPDVVLFN
jgi:hypothetical protein